MYENRHMLTDDELINYWRYRAARAEDWNRTIAKTLFDLKDRQDIAEEHRVQLTYVYNNYCNQIVQGPHD